MNGLITITYDKVKNKFLFTRIIDTITLYNGIYISNIYLNIINCDNLLGFERILRNTNIEFVYNVPKYSNQPINVISITNFFIHVNGDLYLNDENYDNHNSSEIDNNNIIFQWLLINLLNVAYYIIIVMVDCLAGAGHPAYLATARGTSRGTDHLGY